MNDRPYAANSFLSVAMGRLFSTAMSGRSKDRPELADIAIPLTAHLPVIAARGGEELVRRLFEPLGYTVEMQGSQLDDKFPEWGASPYFALTLTFQVARDDEVLLWMTAKPAFATLQQLLDLVVGYPVVLLIVEDTPTQMAVFKQKEVAA